MSRTAPAKGSTQSRPQPPDPRQDPGRRPAPAHLVATGEGEHVRSSGTEVLTHARERLVPRVGHILTLFTPSGFGGFFRELAEGDRHGAMDQWLRDRIAARYQAAWVPLATEVRS